MRAGIAVTLGMIVAFGTGATARAYKLKKPPKGDGCTADGSACDVYCDNGNLAGTMYWNGSKWVDDQRSDPTMDGLAKKITAANLTACK